MEQNQVYILNIYGSFFSEQDSINECWAFSEMPTKTDLILAIDEINDDKIRELVKKIFVQCGSQIPEIKEGFYGGVLKFGRRLEKRHGTVHLMTLKVRELIESSAHAMPD